MERTLFISPNIGLASSTQVGSAGPEWTPSKIAVCEAQCLQDDSERKPV
jgi:hypothetical protein